MDRVRVRSLFAINHRAVLFPQAEVEACDTSVRRSESRSVISTSRHQLPSLV